MEYNHPSFQPGPLHGHLLFVFYPPIIILHLCLFSKSFVIIRIWYYGHVLTQSWSTQNTSLLLLRNSGLIDYILACGMFLMRSIPLFFMSYIPTAYMPMSQIPCLSFFHMINYFDHIIIINIAKYPNE
jgi:hypothetical protein